MFLLDPEFPSWVFQHTAMTQHLLVPWHGEPLISWSSWKEKPSNPGILSGNLYYIYISIHHTHNIANCNSRLGIGFPSAMAASSLVVMVCQGIPSFWPMSGSKSMGIRGCRWMFVKQYHKPPFWWFIPPIFLLFHDDLTFSHQLSHGNARKILWSFHTPGIPTQHCRHVVLTEVWKRWDF